MLIDYCKTFYGMLLLIEFTQHFFRGIGAIMFDPLLSSYVHTVYTIKSLTWECGICWTFTWN